MTREEAQFRLAEIRAEREMFMAYDWVLIVVLCNLRLPYLMSYSAVYDSIA
jgi:hypothetical protein